MMSPQVVSSASGCLSFGLRSDASFASLSSAGETDHSNTKSAQDPSRIQKTFTHADQASIDSDCELGVPVPLKSVSEPSMKKSEALSPAIHRHSRHFATISFTGTPAPSSPLEASKARRTQKAKTLKCLRFDFSPSFFGGNVPDEASVREIQKENSVSFVDTLAQDAYVRKIQEESTPFSGDKIPNDENGAGTEVISSQKPHSYLAPIASEQTISVKNTFVHLDRSLSEDDDDSDDCDCLPKRCKSAPAMPVLNDNSIGVMRATKSLDASACGTPCGTPCSMMEYDVRIFPKGLEDDAHLILQRPLDMPWGCCPPATSSSSGNIATDFIHSRQTSSSSVMDASCSTGSCNFRVKNTFVHVEVNKEEEEDDSHSLTRRVSEPVFKFWQDASPANASLQDASPVNVPAAPTLPSIGASLHSSGQCKPCAWFWKPESCQWGAECQHCHLCPIGELRRRKKERQAEAKEMKREAGALTEEIQKEAATLAENGEGFQ